MSIAEFDATLKELKTLKAPGVSGSRIKKLVTFAVDNVSQESQLVDVMYDNFKLAPPTHKLGYVYVIDAVARRYFDLITGNPVNSDSKNGSFEAGVYKIQNIIKQVIEESFASGINEEQKEKLSKLVDIWSRFNTFESSILKDIKYKYFRSTTPPGSPPSSRSYLLQSGNATETRSDPTAILQQLASQAGSVSKSAPNPSSTSSFVSPPAANAPVLSDPNDPNAIFQMLQQMHGGQMAQYQQPHQAQQMQQPLQQSHPQYQQFQPAQGQFQSQSQTQSYQDYRDRNEEDHSRRNDQRSRSRSPRRREATNSSDSPTLFPGERNDPSNPHFRQKPLYYDNTLPQGSVKVLSRTVFVGGVNPGMDEIKLSTILRPFAEVQSVILNPGKKIAFVKVYSRQEAENVINNFVSQTNTSLRTRWGVGYGPRDCCDYQRGVSIIPIDRLTDADRRWAVEAGWGGTGGEPLTGGQVFEEPDIEVGHGVSSKAISRKMPTNSARNGPRSNRPGEMQDNVTPSASAVPQFAPNLIQSNPLGKLFNSPSSNTTPNTNMNPLNSFASPPPQMQPTIPLSQSQQHPSASTQPDVNALFQNLASLVNNQNK
ncbi:hypothetical protein LJB42_002356 [Komagataella kurtzmanii]|nr:hypothetical protein LJB42_002356 [Komagataella kurtzmanii]